MFSGPMFRWEYHAATRRRRPFVLRTSIAVVLGLVTLLVAFVVFRANTGQGAPHRMVLFGRAVFIVTLCMEVLFLVFFVPVLVGGAIAEERERDTLPLLLLTRLTPIEIVLTKAVARWLSTANLILTGVPVIVAAAWAGGLEVQMMLALPALFSCSAFMASLAILASSARQQAATARAQATAWIFGWLIGPPIMSIVPIGTTSLWGMLLSELKAFCLLVAPSSPVSLVSDHAWLTRPRVASLADRIGWMIGLQAMFGLLALVLAASRLKARETNPNWLDPTRGYRPPCGDDPIYWREYELPTRRGGGSVLGLRLRYVVILIKAILINYFALVIHLLLVAIPIGLLVATLYYGLAAFQELRQFGYGPDGPFVERMHFNLLVRAATALLALFPLLNLSSLVSGRIIAERDKKTWDALLTTPLTGEDILRSKARAALHGLRQTILPLPALWVLGIACGAVLPLGVLFAAVDLLLAVWLNLALGIYLSVRPGSTSSASSRIALMSIPGI